MKTEDETMPTKPVQDNYFSSGVNRKSNDLLKGTFEMKDKFEAAIRDKCRERLGRNNVVGIIEAAIDCDTLHQQAMKEAVDKAIKEERERVTNDLKALFYIK